MSKLQSVTLVYLPGSNFLIGTFNATSTTDWWVSSGFEGVETVEKGLQVYGSIHIAICKKIDGTWSIFKSDDYAQTWHEVLNIAYKIYDCVKILPGRIILNTANGFYETVNSGVTWTLVLGLPSAPNASAICNIGSGDILMCTDGRYIWRSVDLARSWTQVADQNTIHIHTNTDDGHISTITWTGTSLFPAIAGANGMVLCAHGPFLTISHDNGKTFTSEWSWSQADVDSNWYISTYGLSPSALLAGCMPTTSGNATPKFVIKQILVSSINGPEPTDVMYVVRIDDLSPCSLMPGGTSGNTLYSRVFCGYKYPYVIEGFGADESGPAWKYVFKNVVSPSDNLNQLASYELPVTGNSSFIDRIVISAQSNYIGGVLKPTMSYSIDGGLHWTKILISTIAFSLPSDTGASIFDENFAKITWTWGSCENAGDWNFTEDHWRKLQSYDMDWVLQSYETLEKTYDIRVKIEPPTIISIEYDMGVYVLGRHSVPMLHDSLIEVTNNNSYLNTLILEQMHNVNCNFDEITEIDREMPYEMLVWIERTVHEPYVMSYHTEVSSSSSYAMTAWFGQVTVPDIDWASPQWWNLIFPDSNRPPLNSRGAY